MNSFKMSCPLCLTVFLLLIQVTNKHLCIEKNYSHPEFWPFLQKKIICLKFIVKISNFAFSVACPTNNLYDESVVPANFPEYLSCGAFHTVMLVCWLK